MNEFRKGLRRGFISLACALDAADEIERLEAERDALRADLRDELERADAWHKMFLETQKHNDELRAERDLHNATKELFLRMKAERDALRKWKEDNSEAMRVFARYRELEAERDALRELLREAREYTGYAAFYGDRIEADHAVDLCARIDALLNKGGGDD